MHQISNEILSIAVKQRGAELCSIKSTAGGQEYMWNADPNIWASTSPVLFPIVGGLKDNTYVYRGISYTLPRHGFFRQQEKIQLITHTENSLSFQLTTNEETLKVYPFEFRFTITYSLLGSTIRIHHLVENTGNDQMYFSLGAHPAFACPLHPGETYEDYYLEFEHSETLHTWDLNDQGLIYQQGRLVMDHTPTLPLHRHLFDHDALIFKNPVSNWVALKSNKNPHSVTVRFDNFQYLGLWAKPGAAYVCIEPWLGIADSHDTDGRLERKEGILHLEKGGSFETKYEIRIEGL